MALLQSLHVVILLQSPTTKAGRLPIRDCITPLHSSSGQLSLLTGSLYEAMANYHIGCR
ncbi:hypothetical protein C4D60_Mb02t02780 [Musa balbisiana]|uniref:Uncharacterized protein n=1 Tax=Musa balbisiana TaxID=52838 RepID=A0A4S8IA56_MUSBA|nr:hypothetical protein C4D60_Mb02t02780 [Musa balbisiana]